MAKSLEESKKILADNFAKLQKVYMDKYKKEFLKSEDFKMFFPCREEFDKIIEWNNNASFRDDLVDITGFYELCLGCSGNADIIVLGANPGAGDFDIPKKEKEFTDFFQEMEQRKEAEKKGLFYPFYSIEAMRKRFWFPARLIFGIGARSKFPSDNAEKNGILSKFISTIDEATQYADRICSIELVPYHTVDFKHGQKLIEKFGLIERVLAPVRNAMSNRKIILLPYGTTRDAWFQYLPELKNYEFAYTTHKGLNDKNAEQGGSLNIDKLRLWKNIDKPRTADENCAAIFDRLKELWLEKI